MTRDSDYTRKSVKFNEGFLDFFSDRHAETHAAFFIKYIKSGMRVLDCGCGPGSITIDFAKIVAPEDAVGIDIEPAQIKNAKRLQKIKNISNVEFQVGDINKLPYEEETFDAVFTHGVIEYFNDPVHAFKEIRRVLKKGGVIGARHGDWGGFLLASEDEYTKMGFSLFIQLMEKTGGDPYFGRHQASYLRKANFSNIVTSASYDCWTPTLQTAHRVGDFMKIFFKSEEFVKPVLDFGLTDKQTLHKIQASFETWGIDSDIFAAEAWVESVAWKK